MHLNLVNARFGYFTDKDLEISCSFAGANLRHSNFENTDLVFSVFTEADIRCVSSLDCERLIATVDWETTTRDPFLDCGASDGPDKQNLDKDEGGSEDDAPIVKDVEAQSVQAPASDRIVSLKDNQNEVAELREELEALKTAVLDNKKNVFEEKDIVLDEIEASILGLSKPRIRIEPWRERTLWVATYLLSEFGGGVIGEIASRVIDLLGTFFM